MINCVQTLDQSILNFELYFKKILKLTEKFLKKIRKIISSLFNLFFLKFFADWDFNKKIEQKTRNKMFF